MQRYVGAACGIIPRVAEARLAALAANVNHPTAEANLYLALGMKVVAPDTDTVEVRVDDGFVLRLLRGDNPSGTHFGFRVRDVADAAQQLTAVGYGWRVRGPNHISVEHGGSTVYVLQAEPSESPGLIASTHFAVSVPSSAIFYRALGLGVGDADNVVDTFGVDRCDPPNPSADVFFDNEIVLQLWPAGRHPVTLAHMVIRVDDVQAAARGLDELSWRFERDDDALVTRDPDGCRVRVTGPLRSGYRN